MHTAHHNLCPVPTVNATVALCAVGFKVRDMLKLLISYIVTLGEIFNF